MASSLVVRHSIQRPASGGGSASGGNRTRKYSAHAPFVFMLLIFVLASCVHGAASNVLWSFDLDAPGEVFSNTSVAVAGFVSALVASAMCWMVMRRSLSSRWMAAVFWILGATVLLGGGLNNVAQLFTRETMGSSPVLTLLTVTQVGPFLLPIVIPTLAVIAVIGYTRRVYSQPLRALRIVSFILLGASVSLAELFSFGLFYSDGLGIGGILLAMLLVPAWCLLAIACLVLLVYTLITAGRLRE